jgi:hypothetical protein
MFPRGTRKRGQNTEEKRLAFIELLVCIGVVVSRLDGDLPLAINECLLTSTNPAFTFLVASGRLAFQFSGHPATTAPPSSQDVESLWLS